MFIYNRLLICIFSFFIIASCSHIPFLKTDKPNTNIDNNLKRSEKLPNIKKTEKDKRKYKIALILPTKHRTNLRNVANSMVNAAKMAMESVDKNTMELIIYNTDGTSSSTIPSIIQAIENNVDIILGPLAAHSVNSVKKYANNNEVPMLAFSSDRTVVKGEYTHLLSYLAEHNISEITSYAIGKKHKNFAIVGSNSPYSQRVKERFKYHLDNYGAKIALNINLDTNSPDMWVNVKQLTSDEKPKFSAVLFTDSSQKLMKTLPILDMHGFPFNKYLIMGTGLWHEPNILKLQEIDGAVFAAPDHRKLSAFEQNYIDRYGKRPPQISNLAYDAIALVAALIRNYDDPFKLKNFTNPRGFSGIGGVFRFNNDGLTERKLNILKIKDGAFEVIKNANQSF